MNPALIIFAIEAGVKLGRKAYDVFVDETVERALVFPVGELFGSVQLTRARRYFAENLALVGEGGPYHGFSDDELLTAYRSLRVLGARVGDPELLTQEPIEIVLHLKALDQIEAEFGAGHPAKRIFGTVVEIGIDYFAANPSALGPDSKERKVLHAFLVRLAEVDLAEAEKSQIVGDLVVAALGTLNENLSLIDDDRRLQVLLGGVTEALIQDVSAAANPAERIGRSRLAKRLASSVLRGGVAALHENVGIFVEDDPKARQLVGSALGHVLEGIRGRENLFTNDSVELIFDSALVAVAENAELFSEKPVLSELIRQTATALAEPEGHEVFSEATVAAVLREALDVAQRHAETLIDPDAPEEQLLVMAVRGIAAGLSDGLSGGEVRGLLSKAQLVELTRGVFEEVAKDPEWLLGEEIPEPQRTALAQVIASVASALGDEPSFLVSGEGLVQLSRVALHTAVRNADQLLDLESSDPRTNALFRIVHAAATVASEAEDPRELLSRGVFVDILQRVLPVASANLDALLPDTGEPIARAIEVALALASGALEARINGDNLPDVIEGILREVAWEDLDLADDAAVAEAAEDVLRAA